MNYIMATMSMMYLLLRKWNLWKLYSQYSCIHIVHTYIIIYACARQWQRQFKTYEQNGLAFELQLAKRCICSANGKFPRAKKGNLCTYLFLFFVFQKSSKVLSTFHHFNFDETLIVFSILFGLLHSFISSST